jgi:hypothetical protein
VVHQYFILHRYSLPQHCLPVGRTSQEFPTKNLNLLSLLLLLHYYYYYYYYYYTTIIVIIIITNYRDSAHVYGRVCVCVWCSPAYILLHYVAATGIPLLWPESQLPSTLVVNAPRPSTENKINLPCFVRVILSCLQCSDRQHSLYKESGAATTRAACVKLLRSQRHDESPLKLAGLLQQTSL